MPQDATIQLPFTGGTDQRAAAEYVDPSQRLVSVVNGVFTHEGAVDKRLGVQYLPTTQIPSQPTMGTPSRVVSRGAELLAIDGDNAFSYSAAEGGLWAWRTSVAPCVATREPAVANALGQASFSQSPSVSGFSVAEGSGVRAIAYRTFSGSNNSGTVYVDVQDVATGAYWYRANALGTNGYRPTAIIQGGYLYVFWADTSSNIRGIALNLSTRAWSLVSTIVSDLQLANVNLAPFDATPYVGGSGILIVYGQSQGGGWSYLRALRLEALPALTVSTSFYVSSQASETIWFVSARYDGTLGAVVVAWQQANAGTFAGSVAFYGTNWGPLATPALSMPGFNSSDPYTTLAVEPLTATTAIIVAAQSASLSSHAIYSTSGLVSSVQHSGGVAIGKPFRANAGATTRCYLPFAFQQTSIPSGTFSITYALLDTTNYGGTPYYSPNVLPKVTAIVAPRQGDASWISGNAGADGCLPNVTNVGAPSAGVFRSVVVVTGDAELQFTSGAGINLVTWDFTGVTDWQTCEGGGETYLSGGKASYYDGAGIAELSFFQWPTLVQATPSASGGSMAAGTYEYALVYAYVDAQQTTHRSAAYTFQATTTSASSSVALTIGNVPATDRFAGESAPVVEIYRTAAGLTDYYYVGAVACRNNTGITTLAFTDTFADSSINTNPLLYTTGGVLDSVCPPSLRCLVRHNSRLWGVDDTGYTIWFSTAFNGADAPYFNEALTLQFADGPLTALATLDDKLVVFSATQVWIVTGDGPAVTGQGSDLSSPVVVQSDVGAIDWRSVVSTPLGVFFQAPMGGIYLLGRDLSVTYIGKQVQDYVGPNPTLTSAAFNTVLAAALVPSANHVRFVLTDGTVLFYDYVMQRWGLHLGPGGTVNMTTGAVVSGGWYAVGSDGYVYREKSAVTDAAPWYDTTIGGSQWVTTAVITAWVKLAGLQGYQRARHIMALADWMEAADVEVWARFDYAAGTAYDQQQWFLYSALSAANAAQAQMDMHVKATSTRSQAVQIELKDRAPTGGTATTGQGVRFLGLNFDCQVTGARDRRLGSGVKA